MNLPSDPSQHKHPRGAITAECFGGPCDGQRLTSTERVVDVWRIDDHAPDTLLYSRYELKPYRRWLYRGDFRRPVREGL
jgi:hypothetical protein